VAESSRARSVRRNARLLIGAQIALWGALGTFAAQTPIASAELADGERTTGLIYAIYGLSVATSAAVLGRVMDRAGRRPGLVLAYGLLAAGGGSFAAAVASRSAGGMLLAAVPLGAGAGGALLGRTAMADMFPPERRGRAVGILVVAGTIGAVAAPPLTGAISDAAHHRGWTSALALPWLGVPLLALVAVAFVIAIRPDPRELAPAGAPGAETVRRATREIFRLRPVWTAAVTIAVAQAVMTIYMGVVPIAIHRHGAAGVTVSLVVSLHLAGMFAFSPVIGALLDRWGRRPILLAGCGLLLAGVVLDSFTTGTPLLSAGLVLVGIGWSAAYVGSTAIISDATTVAERGGAVGLADLMAALSGSGAVVAGTLVAQEAGLAVLGFAALVPLLTALVLLAPLREPTRA
jgi:MFS family permease